MAKHNMAFAQLRKTGRFRQVVNLLRRTPYIRIKVSFYVGAALVGGALGLGLGQGASWAVLGVALAPSILWIATLRGGLRRGRWRMVAADFAGIFDKQPDATRQIRALAAIAESQGFVIYGLASDIVARRSFAGYSWMPACGLSGITLRYLDLDAIPGTKLEVETVGVTRRAPLRAGPDSDRVGDRDVATAESGDTAATMEIGGDDISLRVFGDRTNWTAHGSCGAAELFIEAEGVALSSLRLVGIGDLSSYRP